MDIAGLFSGYNVFDVVILSIVFISVLLAFFKGFIKSFFSFLNWVLAAVLTPFLYKPTLPFFNSKFNSEQIASFVAMTTCYFIIFFVFVIINYYIVKKLKRFRCGIFDRSFGFLFGLLRASFIVAVIFLSINYVLKGLGEDRADIAEPKWFVEAKTHNIASLVSEYFIAILPDNVVKDFDVYVQKMVKTQTNNEQKSNNNDLSDKETEFTLSSSQKDTMEKIIASIPKDKMTQIMGEYKGKMSSLSDEQKRDFYKKIFNIYKQELQTGTLETGKLETDKLETSTILPDKIIEQKDLDDLQNTLFADDKESEQGYNPKQQIERLIEGVSP